MASDYDFLRTLTIEPFDPEVHDRAAFSCNEQRIDNYVKNNLRHLHENYHIRAYVASPKDSGEIVGFYALNNHAIDASALPQELLKGLTRYDKISAIYLSALAVDFKHQKKGVGSYLMADAFKRSAQVNESSGFSFFVLDALDEGVLTFYKELGFVELDSTPKRMLLPMKTVRNAG